MEQRNACTAARKHCRGHGCRGPAAIKQAHPPRCRQRCRRARRAPTSPTSTAGAVGRGQGGGRARCGRWQHRRARERGTEDDRPAVQHSRRHSSGGPARRASLKLGSQCCSAFSHSSKATEMTQLRGQAGRGRGRWERAPWAGGSARRCGAVARPCASSLHSASTARIRRNHSATAVQPQRAQHGVVADDERLGKPAQRVRDDKDVGGGVQHLQEQAGGSAMHVKRGCVLGAPSGSLLPHSPPGKAPPRLAAPAS